MTERGFTLIEVLVALTILSVASVALIAVFGVGLDSTARARLAQSQQAVGRNLISEIRASKAVLPQQATGQTDDQQWKWSVLSSDVLSDSGTPVIGLQSITVIVAPAEGGPELKLHTRHFGVRQPNSP